MLDSALYFEVSVDVLSSSSAFCFEPFLSSKNTFTEVKSIVIGIVLKINRTDYSICSSSSELLEFAHWYFVCNRESKSKVILRKFQMKELLTAVEERRNEINNN